MRRMLFVVAVLGLTAGMADRADATLIIYTQTVTGSGTLGGAAYTDALLTLTAIADTANVIASGLLFEVTPSTFTVNIAGLGVAAFDATTTRVFDNPTFSPPTAGFATSAGTILGTQAATFATYDLRTAIGPISGSAFIRPDLTFATDRGGFVITSTSGSVTFQAAATTAVPEPGTIALAASALPIGLGAWLKRRRKAAIA